MTEASGPGWTFPPRPDSDGRAVVLYVDVDDQSWDVASEGLRRGYRLLRARGDREACALIRQYAEDLVAVMLDVDLPGSVLDGILLTRILRGRVPAQAMPPFARDLPAIDAPILLVTGSPDDYSESEVLRYGGDRLLLKPLRLARVTMAVTDWHLARS